MTDTRPNISENKGKLELMSDGTLLFQGWKVDYDDQRYVGRTDLAIIDAVIALLERERAKMLTNPGETIEIPILKN